MESLQQHMGFSIEGIVLCIIGLLLCYVIGKRRFNRRGIGGLQQYNSYGSGIVTTFFEKLLKVIGIVLIIAGLFTILNSHKAKTKKVFTQKPTTFLTQHKHYKKSI